MVITKRSSAISFTVLVLGKSTSMPDCRIGAVIMKMTSSTSTTSTKGTMLISESEVPVWRESCGIGALALLKFVLLSELALSVILFDLRSHFHCKVIHACGELLDVVQIVVVGNHRRDGCEQPGRGGNQRFGNARRHGAKACGACAAQAGESIHHSPDGAEQTDERSHRAGGRQPRHPFLHSANFLGSGKLHAHRYRADAFHPAVRVASRALALQLPISSGINSFQRRAASGQRLRLRQCSVGAEGLQEPRCGPLGPSEEAVFLEDQRPGEQ